MKEEKLYLTRDEDRTLWLSFSKNKPTKQLTTHGWNINPVNSIILNNKQDNFPEVKWEDKEPTEVKLIIKIK